MAKKGDIEMVVVMDTKASEADVARVVNEVEAVGGQAFVSPGKLRTVIGLVGDTARFMELPLATLPHVEQVIRVGKPYKLVARELHQDATIVNVGGVPIGEGYFTIIAGPCAIETGGAGTRSREDGAGHGRAHPARRRVQAPHLSLRVPGTREARP